MKRLSILICNNCYYRLALITSTIVYRFFYRGIMKKFILGCILLSSSSLASALSLDAQRSIFTETLDLQDQQQWEKANKQISNLANYPLTYLTQYNYMNANIAEVSDKEVLDFLEANKNKAVSNNLQRTYLFHLAKEKRWADFLKTRSNIPNHPSLQCYYLQASISQGAGKTVWPEAQKIWLSKTGLPTACGSVYQYYEDNNILTQADIWQRFQLAYNKDKPTLMRSLARKLKDKKQQALAKNILALHKNPSQLSKSRLFNSREADSFPFAVHSLKRLAKRDIGKAMQIFSKLDKKVKFTKDEQKEIKIQFATTIIQNNKTWLFGWLDKELQFLDNVSLIEQRIRYAIKLEDWKNIEHWIKKLPEEERDSTSWSYWQARVLEHKGDSINATKLYKKVATQRSYHGFMAAEKLGLNFPFNAETIEEKHGSLKSLDTELTLIKELIFHQLNQQAKRQWLQLLNRTTPELQQQLGLYAFSKGWAHLSVLASIHSKSWDALNIRFPNAHPELFIKEAKKYDLEETYIYAITRRESSFDEHAKSPVGASGYMQLMPRTAKETARKINLKEYKKVEQLNQGKFNVRLGTAYFNGLLKYYKGNRLLATAAYNAGPNRVDKWFSSSKKKGKKGIKMDSWVESIPYHETRAYVKSILVYNVIYQHMLNKPLKFLKKTELLGIY